jgi:hypothetical protein
LTQQIHYGGPPEFHGQTQWGFAIRPPEVWIGAVREQPSYSFDGKRGITQQHTEVKKGTALLVPG